RILRTFSAAGIPVYEGYGLSESSPGISINGISAGSAKIGTVGRVIKGSEVRIYREEGDYRENEGEIIMHGPNIMAGYYKNPQATAETIREIDGKKWLFTGDIGKFVTDENGIQFLKITDRKKELLKTSNGKYVAPSHIEVALKESFLIEQAMVVGDNKKFVSALVVPFGEGLKSWCERKQITWNGLEQAIKEKVIIDRYQRAINDINKNLSKTEQIKKFTLIKDSWEPIKKDGTEAELTPTLKLKRRVILEKYASLIDLMYE
ncbi:MAG: AMP-binding protein, partial [Saprospiraceae bacterium]|nr:AMP-binding protein [Saprospiraceae bacterium]